MKGYNFILNIIKTIDRINPNLINYGYISGNANGSVKWWEVSVSDYDFYFNNERFKKLRKAWQLAAKQKGIKVVFVCGWTPTENKLLELAERGDLVLAV